MTAAEDALEQAMAWGATPQETMRNLNQAGYAVVLVEGDPLYGEKLQTWEDEQGPHPSRTAPTTRADGLFIIVTKRDRECYEHGRAEGAAAALDAVAGIWPASENPTAVGITFDRIRDAILADSRQDGGWNADEGSGA